MQYAAACTGSYTDDRPCEGHSYRQEELRGEGD